MRLPTMPPRATLEKGFAIGIVVVLLATVAVSRWQLHRAQAAGEKNALRASNAIAERDKTRKTALSQKDRIRLLGDSLLAVERLAVQAPKGLARDPFDKATDRTSVARGDVTVTPDRIDASATSSPTTESDDVRSAHFEIDSTRYKAVVDVDVPKPPLLAQLRLGVTLPPIKLEPRWQCGAPDAGGIRPTTLALISPQGYEVTIGRLEADVHTCNPDFGKPRGIRVPLWTVGAGAGLGVVLGVLIAH